MHVIAPGPSRRLLNLLPQKMFPGRRWKSPGFSHSNKNILVVKFTVYLIGRSNFPVTGYNKCMIFVKNRVILFHTGDKALEHIQEMHLQNATDWKPGADFYMTCAFFLNIVPINML
jgi:hypothetical protein